MDVESLVKQLILQNMSPEQQAAVLSSVRATLEEARTNQKRRVSENVGMVVDALKKIEEDIRARYDELGQKITDRVNSIRDGVDGVDGKDGKDGKDGRPGRDGATGPMGPAGRDGRDGIDGVDGVSVTDAKIDFDGSLVISLSNGREINVGEVVAPDLAERIKVITNGGGTSQEVLDTLASLQAQIDALVVLDYKGTWNASTNTPTLASGVGDPGSYYIVSVAGSTNLDGITDWQPGDWAIFNGTEWQKIDQSWATAGVNNNITSMTGITGGISSPDFIQFDTTYATTLTEGQLGWDGNNTLGLGMAGGNVIQHIGEDQFFYCKATSAITKGQVVMFTGAVGASGVPTGAPATGITDGTYIMGIAAESIAHNGFGLVQTFGTLRNVNTSGYADGDILWYDPSVTGGLTKTKPLAPNVKVQMAAVINGGSSGGGTILIRIDPGSILGGTDSNVGFSTLASGNTIIYDAVAGYWKNANLTDGTGISITEGAGSITVTNTAPDQTVSLTGAGTTSITGTYPNFTVTSNDQYTGTVTSVGGTGTVNGISLSGTVTSSGSLTLGGTLSNVSLSTQVTGTLPIANGGTGQTSQTAAFDALAPTTTKGDLIVSNGSDNVRLPVGADTYVLTADSTQASGVKWAAGGGSGVTSLTGTANEVEVSASTGAVTVGLPSTINVDLNGSVGATTPNTGSFTSLTDSGNLTFTGTGARITGDFSNATVANRVGFQTSTTNGNTNILVLPNGTGSIATHQYSNNSDITNASTFVVGVANSGTEARLNSSIQGTGTYLPMTFFTGGSERMRIDTSGNVGVGTATVRAQEHIYGAGQTTAALTDAGNRGGMLRVSDSGTDAGNGGAILFSNQQGDLANSVGFAAIKGLLVDGSNNTAGSIAFSTRSVSTDTALTEQARITTAGLFQFNSGYGSVATAYGCRAWVNFNGTANSNVTSQSYSQTGTTVTITSTAHGLITGNSVYLDFTSGTAVDGVYTVTRVDDNTFTVTQASRTTSGLVTIVKSTIRASGNVSSVADNGTGLFAINFATAMPDANYAASGGANTSGANYNGIVFTTYSAQSLSIEIRNGAGTLNDKDLVGVIVFR